VISLEFRRYFGRQKARVTGYRMALLVWSCV